MKGKGGEEESIVGLHVYWGYASPKRRRATSRSMHSHGQSASNAAVLRRIQPQPLKPTHKHVGSDADDDDEDAEEQAQVLFYTAKDHAVSKDRVLRQVGLSKALVNFSKLVKGPDVQNLRNSDCNQHVWYT